MRARHDRMRRLVLFLTVFGVATSALGCGAVFEGLPRYVDSHPPPLSRSSAPTTHVTLHFAPIAMNTWLGAGGRSRGADWNFRLALASADATVPLLTTLGDVRTRDVSVHDYSAIACAYMALPAGESARPCAGVNPAEARAKSEPLVDATLDELRAVAASAGADAVAQVRCFAHASRSSLWCEGLAGVRPKPPANAQPRSDETTSTAPVTRPAALGDEGPRTYPARTEIRPARIVIGASSGAMVTSLAGGPVAGVHVLARPVEITVRGALVTDPLAALGEIDVAARKQLGAPWVDLLAGAGIGAAGRFSPEEVRGTRATVPLFAGVHVQPRSSGRVLEPFARARGGYRFVVADVGGHGALAAPFGEVVVGVYWPEAR